MAFPENLKKLTSDKDEKNTRIFIFRRSLQAHSRAK